MRLPTGLAFVATVIVALGIGCALATADTGGSMGGGSWGGGGGGGGGGGHSSSNSSSSRSYSSSDGSRGGGGSLSPGAAVVLVIVIGVAGAFQYATQHRSTGSNLGSYLSLPSYDPTSDVSVLRIAIDGRARKFVQDELARIARTANTATVDGRHQMLAEVSLMLRRLRDAWVYGGAVNEPMRSMMASKAAFDRHVTEARAKFLTETVRNAQGAVTTAPAPASIPRSHEGAGLILVSIIVAARTELFTVAHIGNGEDLRKALESAVYRDPNDLVAIEIVWQPSDDADRLSSIELEAKYPRPALIPIQDALVGKAFCSYCGGPYPAELVTCPHCGAPGDARPASQAA